MPEFLQISLTPEAVQLTNTLGDKPWLMESVAKGLDKQNQLTIGHIIRRYASFPRSQPPVNFGLRVQSGQYRRSLNAPASVVHGFEVVSGIGSSLKYAEVHEFGFSGSVQVHAHKRRRTRMTFDAGYVRLGRRVTIRKKVQAQDVFVKGYTRQMNLRARAPIQSGIKDRLQAIGEGISAAMIKAFKKNNKA